MSELIHRDRTAIGTGYLEDAANPQQLRDHDVTMTNRQFLRGKQMPIGTGVGRVYLTRKDDHLNRPAPLHAAEAFGFGTKTYPAPMRSSGQELPMYRFPDGPPIPSTSDVALVGNPLADAKYTTTPFKAETYHPRKGNTAAESFNGRSLFSIYDASKVLSAGAQRVPFEDTRSFRTPHE